jgi:hydrogenase-4 component E
VLWRRELTAVVRLLAVQGLALAAIALLMGLAGGRWELVGVAVGVGVLRGGLLPHLLRRALSGDGTGQATGHEAYDGHAMVGAESADGIEGVAGAEGAEGTERESRPVAGVAAALLAAAALTLLAFAVSRPLVRLDPAPAVQALPVGLAAVLIGFFALATRRRAAAQAAGFLLLDNGVTATAFLAASGVPLIVELGVSFDLLLAVLVLRLLTARLRETFGTTDTDELRELHD